MSKFSHTFAFAALLLLGAGCSKQQAPSPSPSGRSATADNVAPIDPGTGGGGGGGTGGGGAPTCTPAAPSQSIKDGIKAYTVRQCRLNGWTIVTTITPPDGITYGLGCAYSPYPFSVDIIDQGGRSTYASGTYNSGTGAYTLAE